MRKILLPLIAAFVLSLVAHGSASAAHCISPAPPPVNCFAYAPDAPAGFVMVASTYTPANGEWVGCESSGNYCIRAAIGAGGFWNVANLGDFAASGGLYGNWPIRNVKSRMCRTTTLYTGFNWTGSSFGYLGNCTSVYSATLPGGFNPSSLSLQN